MFNFLKKTTSCACLLGSVLNYIFHWKAHLLIFSKPVFISFADISVSWTFAKREVSSANILHIDVFPSGRSFRKTKQRDPHTDPFGCPDFIFLYSDIWLFDITLYLQLFTIKCTEMVENSSIIETSHWHVDFFFSNSFYLTFFIMNQ